MVDILYNYKFKDKVSLGNLHDNYDKYNSKRKIEEIDSIITNARIDLPEKLDYRNLIKNIIHQENLPCGTSNTIINAIHLLYSIINQKRWFYKLPTDKLSRLYNYWNAKIIEKTNIFSDEPTMLESGLLALEQNNICLEKLYEYKKENISVYPNLNCYINANSINHKIQYHKLDNSINVIKSELYSGHPVLLGIVIYESYYKNDGLLVNPDILNDKKIGGHTILLVGCNNIKKYFIFQNSVGESFGTNGFGYIEYDYILNTDICGDIYSIY